MKRERKGRGLLPSEYVVSKRSCPSKLNQQTNKPSELSFRVHKTAHKQRALSVSQFRGLAGPARDSISPVGQF